MVQFIFEFGLSFLQKMGLNSLHFASKSGGNFARSDRSLWRQEFVWRQ